MIDGDELFQGVLPFAAVARTRSFSQAAAQLGVSPPAISKALRKLEQRLGLKLLTRTSRSVALTPEGERYLQRCEEAIGSMQAARERASSERHAPSGELRVSMSIILGPKIIPALPRFVDDYPKVSLRVSLSDRVSKLQEERIDVGVRVGVRNDSNLIQKRLLSPRWITVASPAFVARHGVPRTPSDLAQMNCLRFLLPNGKPRDFSFQSDAAPPVVQAVGGNLLIDDGEQLLEAALAGMGIAQVLDFMTREHLAAGTLLELLPTFSAVGPVVYAVCAPERRRSPNVRALTSFLAELFSRS